MRDYLFNLAFVEIQGTPKLSELAWVDLMLKGRPLTRVHLTSQQTPTPNHHHCTWLHILHAIQTKIFLDTE